MALAIALIVGVVALAAVLLGILWALIFLVPLYVYIAAFAYFVWRARRREADLYASVRREAEQQRLFNEQEMRAWQADPEKKINKNATRRERALRDFDRSQDPSNG